MPAEAQCGICLDNFKIGLDGVLCRAVGDSHFVCTECFTGHVIAEAERQEFTGDVYYPYHSPAMGGCASKCYADCVVSRRKPNACRLQLREKHIVETMQRDFDAWFHLEKKR